MSENPFHQPRFQRVFGTWPLQGRAAEAAILTALETGYRAIDTAQIYNNEDAVGRALAASGLTPDSLCITTKVTPANYTRDRFRPSVERSLAGLGLETVDVLLLHWPPPDGNLAPRLAWLQDVHTAGLARSIGVSNFTSHMLAEARTVLDVPLVTNQVEFHPLLDQSRLLQAATAHGIPLTAYCSLARGAICKEPELMAIGQAHDKSASQVALRWIIQKGVVPITMSSRPANIRANFAIMDFTLSPIDIQRIDRLTQRNQRVVTDAIVPHAPQWD